MIEGGWTTYVICGGWSLPATAPSLH